MDRFPGLLLTLAVVITLLAGCASNEAQVSRLEDGQEVDLTGRWNFNDSRRIAQGMTENVLRQNNRWLENFRNLTEKKPYLAVLRIENRTSDHIDEDDFMSEFEAKMVNSGRIGLVERDQLDQLDEEQRLQARRATQKSAAAIGQEIGADFALFGSIRSNDQRAGNLQVREYQVSLRLVDTETSEIVWIGNENVRKVIKRASVAW